MKSTVILCADDFGISAGVNRAIIDLAAQGRLSAVSCMACGEAWAEGGKTLKAVNANIDVGLHLTFTYLKPLAMGEHFPSEKEVILKSWARLLDKTTIEKEIRAQFVKFIEVWGAPPDFIDGHQHVHVLPVIRDALLRLRAEYAPHAWMRNVVDFAMLKENKKYGILAVLGWRWLQLLKKHNIPYNRLLRGAYDYNQPVDYAALMEKQFAETQEQLVYCHPGFPDAGLEKVDNVLEPRRKEHAFFSGALFGSWLEKQQVKLIRRPS